MFNAVLSQTGHGMRVNRAIFNATVCPTAVNWNGLNQVSDLKHKMEAKAKQ